MIARLEENRQPKIKNYKISFKIRNFENFLTRMIGVKIKKYHNFIVVRSEKKFVFTIFNSSGFVNATGIKTKEECEEARQFLIQLLQCEGSEYKTDNICASGHFGKEINLLSMKKEFLKHKHCFTFNPDQFAGASLKLHTTPGCMVIFSTGSYSILGVRDDREIQHLFEQIEAQLLQANYGFMQS